MSSSYAAVPARQTQSGVVLQWANTIAVIVTIVFNILSQALPIGNLLSGRLVQSVLIGAAHSVHTAGVGIRHERAAQRHDAHAADDQRQHHQH